MKHKNMVLAVLILAIIVYGQSSVQMAEAVGDGSIEIPTFGSREIKIERVSDVDNPPLIISGYFGSLVEGGIPGDKYVSTVVIDAKTAQKEESSINKIRMAEYNEASGTMYLREDEVSTVNKGTGSYQEVYYNIINSQFEQLYSGKWQDMAVEYSKASEMIKYIAGIEKTSEDTMERFSNFLGGNIKEGGRYELGYLDTLMCLYTTSKEGDKCKWGKIIDSYLEHKYTEQDINIVIETGVTLLIDDKYIVVIPVTDFLSYVYGVEQAYSMSGEAWEMYNGNRTFLQSVKESIKISGNTKRASDSANDVVRLAAELTGGYFINTGSGNEIAWEGPEYGSGVDDSYWRVLDNKSYSYGDTGGCLVFKAPTLKSRLMGTGIFQVSVEEYPKDEEILGDIIGKPSKIELKASLTEMEERQWEAIIGYAKENGCIFEVRVEGVKPYGAKYTPNIGYRQLSPEGLWSILVGDETIITYDTSTVETEVAGKEAVEIEYELGVSITLKKGNLDINRWDLDNVRGDVIFKIGKRNEDGSNTGEKNEKEYVEGSYGEKIGTFGLVSAEFAKVLSGEQEDQREHIGYIGSSAKDIEDSINESLECSGDSYKCRYSELDCKYYSRPVLSNLEMESERITDSITGYEYELPSGCTLVGDNTVKIGSKAIEIPMANLGLSYRTSAQIWLKADISTAYLNKSAVILGFDNYYLEACQNDPYAYISNGGKYKLKVLAPIADGSKHRVEVMFDFLRMDRCKAAVDGIESDTVWVRSDYGNVDNSIIKYTEEYNQIDGTIVGGSVFFGGSRYGNEAVGLVLSKASVERQERATEPNEGVNRHNENCYTIIDKCEGEDNWHKHTAECLGISTEEIIETNEVLSGAPNKFYYTGGIQTYTVPADGLYRLTVYGAQGGTTCDLYNSKLNNAWGGKGGKTTALARLTKGTVIYVVVGGKGVAADGGYNGGGQARINGGGGGATHMALASGQLWQLKDNREKVLIVAGGGGGGSSRNLLYYSVCAPCAGGDGGGNGSENGGNAYYSLGELPAGYSYVAGGTGGTLTAPGSYSSLSGYNGTTLNTAGFGYGGSNTGYYLDELTEKIHFSKSQYTSYGADPEDYNWYRATEYGTGNQETSAAGGGGWYGGGSGGANARNNVYTHGAGGGGSSYIREDLQSTTREYKGNTWRNTAFFRGAQEGHGFAEIEMVQVNRKASYSEYNSTVVNINNRVMEYSEQELKNILGGAYEYAVQGTPLNLVYKWEFKNDNRGWFGDEGSKIVENESSLSLMCLSDTAGMSTYGQFSATGIDSVVVRLRNKGTDHGRAYSINLYWNKDGSSKYDEIHKLTVPIACDDLWHNIKIPTKDTHGWEGTIRQLRIVAEGAWYGEGLEISSISLYGTGSATESVQGAVFDCNTPGKYRVNLPQGRYYIELYGAQGGGELGGLGGKSTGTIVVSENDSKSPYIVYVGGQDGFNGGGWAGECTRKTGMIANCYGTRYNGGGATEISKAIMDFEGTEFDHVWSRERVTEDGVILRQDRSGTNHFYEFPAVTDIQLNDQYRIEMDGEYLNAATLTIGGGPYKWGYTDPQPAAWQVGYMPEVEARFQGVTEGYISDWSKTDVLWMTKTGRYSRYDYYREMLTEVYDYNSYSKRTHIFYIPDTAVLGAGRKLNITMEMFGSEYADEYLRAQPTGVIHEFTLTRLNDRIMVAGGGGGQSTVQNRDLTTTENLAGGYGGGAINGYSKGGGGTLSDQYIINRFGFREPKDNGGTNEIKAGGTWGGRYYAEVEDSGSYMGQGGTTNIYKFFSIKDYMYSLLFYRPGAIRNMDDGTYDETNSRYVGAGGGGGWYGGQVGLIEVVSSDLQWGDQLQAGGGGGSGYANTSNSKANIVYSPGGADGVQQGDGRAVIYRMNTVYITVGAGEGQGTGVTIDTDELMKHIDLIPSTVEIDGTVVNNPIFICGNMPLNEHRHTEGCTITVLHCTEPHHIGGSYHYGMHNRICWSACDADENHKKYSDNHNDSVCDECNGGTGANMVHIDTDMVLCVPNKGRDSNNKIIDTYEWTRTKRIKLQFNATYEGKYYAAGEWITLGDRGEYTGDLDSDYDESKWSLYGSEEYEALKNNHYTIHCELNNEEALASKIVIDIASIHSNGPNTNVLGVSNLNRYGGHIFLNGAAKNIYVDVVGQIGNLMIEDTKDERFRWLFKFGEEITVNSKWAKNERETFGTEAGDSQIEPYEQYGYSASLNKTLDIGWTSIEISGNNLRNIKIGLIGVNGAENTTIRDVSSNDTHVVYYVKTQKGSGIQKIRVKGTDEGQEILVERLIVTYLGSGISRKFENDKQIGYMTWVKDIFGKEFDTGGTINKYGEKNWLEPNNWIDGKEPSRHSLPLGGDSKHIEDNPGGFLGLNPGSDVYWGIETVGNYWNYQLEVDTRFYAMNTLTGDITPVNIWKNMGNGYKLVNSFYGNAQDEDSLVVKWDEMKNFINYTEEEKARTENIINNSLINTLPISGGEYSIGTDELYKLDGNLRTFIGEGKTWEWEKRAQRWHGITKLTEGAVIMNAGTSENDGDTPKSFSSRDEEELFYKDVVDAERADGNDGYIPGYEFNYRDEATKGKYVLVCTVRIKANGELFNLIYSHGDINGSVGNIPIEDPNNLKLLRDSQESVIAIYSTYGSIAGGTIEYDLTGTH